MTKPLGKIGTIGHIDHGKTTLSAAISTVIDKSMHDVVVIGAQDEPEEKSITNVFGPQPIIIKNYSATYLVENKIQPTGKQLRNQRRKKTKKNGRNRK